MASTSTTLSLMALTLTKFELSYVAGKGSTHSQANTVDTLWSSWLAGDVIYIALQPREGFHIWMNISQSAPSPDEICF